MDLKSAIEILENHNKWRRDDEGRYEMSHPKDLGVAIDIVVSEFKDTDKKDMKKKEQDISEIVDQLIIATNTDIITWSFETEYQTWSCCKKNELICRIYRPIKPKSITHKILLDGVGSFIIDTDMSNRIIDAISCKQDRDQSKFINSLKDKLYRLNNESKASNNLSEKITRVQYMEALGIVWDYQEQNKLANECTKLDMIE